MRRKNRRLELLRRSLDVGGYPKRDLRRLARLFREEHYGPGASICTEGEVGHEAYLIVEGSAQVTISGRKIRVVGPGDLFGELALLEDAPRSATVRALEPLIVLTVDRQRFPALMSTRATKARITASADRYVRRKTRQAPGTLDPVAWKTLLYTARRERIRRRRIRLTATTAVLLVLTLVAGMGIRALADRSTPVSVDEALVRFREAQQTAARAPDAQPVVSAETAQAVQPGSLGAASVSEVLEGSGEAAPSGVEDRPLPVPGVYVYSTTGGEEVSLFGGSRHTYPQETTLTITPSGCGMDVRWAPLAERWEQWQACVDGRAARLDRVVTYREFYKVRDHREFACTSGVYLLPPTSEAGATFRGRCDGTDAGADTVTTVLGVETVSVGGQAVPAVHVRTDQVLDGKSRGTKTDETWYALDTGLLLRHMSRTDAEAETVAGHATYREEFTLQIVSLTPRT